MLRTFKIAGLILLAFLLIVIFIEPIRKHINSFFQEVRKDRLKEEELIGVASGYNPRVDEVQKALKEIGLNPGSIDGIMGSQTRVAIKEFQKSQKLKVTGKIDNATWVALNREKVKSNFPAEIVPKNALKISTSAPSEEGLRKAVGVLDKDTEEALRERLKSKEGIKQIQAALRKAGFYQGKIDGIIMRRTKRAIREFQKSKGLKPDGMVGPKTWAELSKYLKD